MGDWWAAGVSLDERGPASDLVVPGEPDERWLADWRATYGDGFAERLGRIGLRPEDVLRLRAEPPARLAARTPEPEWARIATVHEGHEGREGGGATWIDAFASVFAPFLDVADDRLRRSARFDDVDEAAVRAGLRTSLGPRIAHAAARALVVDLDEARDRLAGATPRERFDDFVRQAGRDLGDLVRRRPVLARIVADMCRYAADSTAETLRRHAADRDAIRTTFFGGDDPGALVEVEPGAGDRHLRGRSVALLRYENGARLVYKPRPLAAHRHFNDLVAWVSGHVPDAPRTLRLLDRGGYGWTEFVTAEPCGDRTGLERFYRRHGLLLALLYALDGADVHLENLIACGEHPVLVDVETLFHPVPPSPESIGDPAEAALSSSVYRCALLPHLMLGDDDAVDVSGMTGGGDLPLPVVRWEDAGTDRMRLVRVPGTPLASDNRPGDEGAEAYAESLIAGFRAGYDLLAAHRDDLLAPGGLVTAFAADEMRFVARPTRLYATLLDESTHPDVLGDALDRDRVFDVLGAGSADDPIRKRLVPHECAELWQGDVPIFTLRPGGTGLTSGTGAEIPGVLDVSPLDQVAAKLHRLGDVDRADQEWIIRASLATRHPHERHDPGPELPAYPAAAPEPDRLLEAARTIANQILAAAHHDDDRVNWLGLEPLDDTHWTVMPLGAGLGTGYPGVALFLAQLASVTGEDRYARVASRALRNLPPLLEALAASDDSARIVGCGGFSGFGGIAYAVAQVAVLLNDDGAAALVDPALALAGRALDDPGEMLGAGEYGRGDTGGYGSDGNRSGDSSSGDAGSDGYGTGGGYGLGDYGSGDGYGSVGLDVSVHDGVAGCLASALAVYELTNSRAALDLAHRAARRLRTAVTAGASVDRASGLPAEPGAGAAAGFAFGRAGVGWALCRYDAAVPNSGLRTYGIGLLREAARAATGPSWCEGASGVALGVLDAGGDVGGELRTFADLTLAATTGGGPLAGHALCHGEFGRLETVTRAGRDARAGMALSSVNLTGPRCGTPGRIPVPGLLDGLAGIGHGLLRLARPHDIAPVLLLRGRAPQTPSH